MSFFGVGPLELLVVLVVALIFVGPERLPRLAADIARTIKEIRKYTGALAAEFQEVVKDVEKETAGEASVWKEVTEGIGGATKQVTEAVREVRKEAFSATETAAAPPGTNGSQPNGALPPANGSAASTPTNGAAAPAQWIDIPDPDAATNTQEASTKAEQPR
jgi:sec-independent protein translocase protein TatB